jgi:hypothetical protein
MADPEPLRVVHGEAVEFTGVDEADLGGLVADRELAVLGPREPALASRALASPAGS